MRIAGVFAFASLLTGCAQNSPSQLAPDNLQEQRPFAGPTKTPARPSGPLQQKVAPGLAHFTDDVLFGKVWPNPALAPRDRSLVVIATLIATSKPAQLRGHLGRALTNGVTAVEASGVLTHVALYAGWPSAVSALEVYEEVYTERKVDLAPLHATLPRLTAESADVALAQSVTKQSSTAAPNFVGLTQQVLFDDLWRRGDLSVRDRSLVTVAVLAAMGDADLSVPYIRRGLEAGLTRQDIEEALTHLAFYAGWGKASKALAALSTIPDSRQTNGATPKNAAPATREVSQRAPAAGSIWRKGSPPITNAPSTNFTGSVQVSSPYRGTGGSRLGGATVTFQPGARTAWHRHPMGQTLIVTEGCGWTQARGGPVEEICPGDVAWIGPNQEHWHGATATRSMTHVTASETVDGQSVEWLEHVTDAEYTLGQRAK